MDSTELAEIRKRHESDQRGLLSTVKFILDAWVPAKCTSEAVADCYRCQTVCAGRWLERANADRAKLLAHVETVRNEALEEAAQIAFSVRDAEYRGVAPSIDAMSALRKAGGDAASVIANQIRSLKTPTSAENV